MFQQSTPSLDPLESQETLITQEVDTQLTAFVLVTSGNADTSNNAVFPTLSKFASLLHSLRMQSVDGQEPAHNSDLVDGAAPVTAGATQKKSPNSNRKPRVKSTEKVVPLAQCFHCDRKVEIAKPELVKTKAGNNKKEGLRFAGHCSLCDRKVGIFVDSNLEVHPKPKAILTPEQKEKKKERSKKKRAKKAEERKAELRKTLGLAPDAALPKKEKKRKADVAVLAPVPKADTPLIKKQRKSKEIAKQ